MLMRSGVFPPLAALVGVLVAIICASLIGGASILFKAPSFIISLAAIGVFQGIALFITQGTIQTIYGQFETLGGMKLFNVVPLLFLIALLGYGVMDISSSRVRSLGDVSMQSETTSERRTWPVLMLTAKN